MAGKRIYETDEVKTFAAGMKITPEMEASMRATFGAGSRPTFTVPTKRELAFA